MLEKIMKNTPKKFRRQNHRFQLLFVGDLWAPLFTPVFAASSPTSSFSESHLFQFFPLSSWRCYSWWICQLWHVFYWCSDMGIKCASFKNKNHIQDKSPMKLKGPPWVLDHWPWSWPEYLLDILSHSLHNVGFCVKVIVRRMPALNLCDNFIPQR